MAVSNLSTRQSFHWIPPNTTAEWKVTVEKDGVEEDISEFVHYVRIFDGVTDTVGEFEFKIHDPNEYYKDRWTGNEIFRFYSDYANTATTLRFRGRIEKPSNRNNMLRVYGRSESKRFLTTSVTEEYDGVEASEIIKDLVSKYGGGNFTTNNIETSNTEITVSWFEKPFWECVQELCSSATSDCYVDATRDFNFFEVGSRENIGEAIVHEQNLSDIGDFAPDLTQVRNNIRVYGATQENTQLIYTAQDSDSITSYGESTEIVRDDNITTQSQIVRIGDAKLAELKDPPTVGEVTSFVLLSTLQPGEKIYLSSPENNIPPSLYDILQYEHIIDLDGEGETTRVTVNKEPRQTALVFRGIIQRLNQTQDTSINPFQMKYTYNDLFNTDSGSHVNTEITDGFLRLQSGQINGTWTSDTQTAPIDVGQAYLVINGQQLSDVLVEISVDGGISYKTITREERITFDDTGKNIKVKITLDDANAVVDSFSIQYKE